MQLSHLQAHARSIRLNAVRMAAVQGQGYVAQALGVADVLSVLWCHVLRYRRDDPQWAQRDRFLLSVGHYAIALYAALMEAGVLDPQEVDTYGCDDSRLPMSGMAGVTPGMEISGGSLGHGLPIGIGMALALRARADTCGVYVLLSDGELNEGSTWEAAQSASHWRLSNLTAIVDVNDQQADGRASDILGYEPLAARWEAFGWQVERVDGHDIPALVSAFDRLRAADAARPRVLICDTRLGRGVPLIERRERSHFVRVEPGEWELALAQLDEGAAS